MPFSSGRLAIYIGSIVVAALALFGGPVADYAILLWACASTAALYWARRSHTGEMRRFSSKVYWLMLLMCIGFVVRGVHGTMIGVESPIPSPADLLHIPAYLLFLSATIQVHRSRAPRPNPDAWLDAAAVVCSLILVLWVTFYADYLVASNLSIATRAVNGIYNSIILVAFTVFVRITATPGVRSPVYYLLGAGAFAFFVVDLAASYSLVRGQGLFLTIALSPIVFGLLVDALRDPNAAELLHQDTESEVRVGPLRLTILATAITAPLVVAVFGRSQPAWSLALLFILTTVLSVLLVVRVLRLLVEQRETAQLDRRLAAQVSSLAALDSQQAIIEQLPKSVGVLLPGAVAVRYAAQGASGRAFPLPQNLAADDRQVLILPEGSSPLEPGAIRVLESLVREAGFIANSVVGLQAIERQKSAAEATRQIAASERRFRALVERSTDIIVVVKPDGEVKYISGAVSQILGYEHDSLIGSPLADLFHPEDASEFTQALAESVASDRPISHEFRLLNTANEARLADIVLTDMLDVPEVAGIVVNANDVTERRRLERDLLDAKITDRLTLLPNRTGFVEELELTARRASLDETPIALAAINIRDFKAINDALGPAAADEVLISFAAKLEGLVRTGDTVARIGGDEFVVLLRDAHTVDIASASLARVLQNLSGVESINGRSINIKCYAGLVFSDDLRASTPDLLRDVDIALSTAKEQATDDLVVFEPVMARQAIERLELRSSLREGLANDEFRLVYQPVLAISDQKIHSVEALARWTHPRLGIVSPVTFIPLAETSGQIEELGHWVLTTACGQLADWTKQGLNLATSINMSVHQLRQPDIVSTVAKAAEQAGVDPSKLTIEVTESVLIDDSEVISRRLKELRKLGFPLAIDDFGTGYSSLSYLQRYEFDILKIDKAFIDPLSDSSNEREREVVRSIIQLAQGLQATTIAEGVEEQVQLEVLDSLGCDYAQGYLLHRPQEVGACTEILKANLGISSQRIG